ncbi:hypothetical protein GWK47_006910 [Chionoecetes opilio]|uniref:Uncharacterized protein n=1 Tax=Chionoecetes opilio TaxID=41210 RepID=A0A8J5CUF2_CHIOP|nr:hypothetical protein GWK47_006910 [Chionoecetes opilio]
MTICRSAMVNMPYGGPLELPAVRLSEQIPRLRRYHFPSGAGMTPRRASATPHAHITPAHTSISLPATITSHITPATPQSPHITASHTTPYHSKPHHLTQYNASHTTSHILPATPHHTSLDSNTTSPHHCQANTTSHTTASHTTSPHHCQATPPISRQPHHLTHHCQPQPQPHITASHTHITHHAKPHQSHIHHQPTHHITASHTTSHITDSHTTIHVPTRLPTCGVKLQNKMMQLRRVVNHPSIPALTTHQRGHESLKHEKKPAAAKVIDEGTRILGRARIQSRHHRARDKLIRLYDEWDSFVKKRHVEARAGTRCAYTPSQRKGEPVLPAGPKEEEPRGSLGSRDSPCVKEKKVQGRSRSQTNSPAGGEAEAKVVPLSFDPRPFALRAVLPRAVLRLPVRQCRITVPTRPLRRRHEGKSFNDGGRREALNVGNTPKRYGGRACPPKVQFLKK